MKVLFSPLRASVFTLSILLVLFVFALSAFAHTDDQSSFFLMNGKYADFYPVYSTSLSDFRLPQDIAPETYLVNQPIEMEIEKSLLPFPPEIIEAIKFTWNFGDGTTEEGTENTHSYSNPGSYLLAVNADYGDYSGPDTQPVIQAVLLHILPNKEYKLPQAVITIDGKKIADPLIDTVAIAEGKEIVLNATSSVKGAAPITEYFWDLGNGKSSTEKTIHYRYTSDSSYVFPFIRIKDANGFISDTYVQIENTADGQTKNASSFLNTFGLPLLIIGNVIILGGALWYILKKRSP